MRYTVVWVPPPEAALARYWMAAPDPQALSVAANRIDRILLVDPERRGKPQGRFFVLEEAPLAVLYEIIPDDCLVRVLSVKTI